MPTPGFTTPGKNIQKHLGELIAPNWLFQCHRFHLGSPRYLSQSPHHSSSKARHTAEDKGSTTNSAPDPPLPADHYNCMSCCNPDVAGAPLLEEEAVDAEVEGVEKEVDTQGAVHWAAVYLA